MSEDPKAEPPASPLILGTAGHIDHGKTALIQRLTGIDTDRLPEEKQRGISIDLGFANLEPRPGLVLSFVDVPGHERFVKNMLAGATGMDAVLFVVAANEGLMPQSREHFDILRLLGLRSLLVVLTKTDLADAEMLELVRLELEEYCLEQLGRVPPIFEVSSKTGAGLAELTEALVELARSQALRSELGAARLSIDRKFVLQGHGTIVTGTQLAGRFCVGDAVEILPAGHKARIRELQSHERGVEATGPGQRVAMKLHGVGLDELARGDVVSMPGALEAGSIFNARVELLASSPLSLEHRTRVRVHLGAAEILARVEPLEGEALEPGGSALIQLRLESPAVAVGGQRFILRRYSPALTIGGGVVLEFPAPKAVRGNARTLEALRLLERGGVAEVALALALRREPGCLTRAELSRELWRRSLPEPEAWSFAGLTRLEGELWLRSERFESCRAGILARLAEHHRQFPLEPGARLEQLRTGADLEAMELAAFQAVLETLQARRELLSVQNRFCLPSFRPLLDEASSGRLEALVELLEREGPWEEAAWLERLKSVGSKPAALHQYLLGLGRVFKLEGFALGRKMLARVLRDCLPELTSAPGLGVAQLRDRTGWTRKLCIPFLELTDGLQLTRRRGDARVRGSALQAFLDP